MKKRKGSDGLHFFDRETGINILLDEVVIEEENWSKAPRQMSVALTNVCDLTCSHCYAPKNKDKLNIEQLKRWLIELDDNDCLGVGFGGGEPTLYPKLLELCEFGQKHTKLSITMTSHGHRLAREYGEKLFPYLNFLRLSMDGVNNVYETIRGKPYSDLLNVIKSIEGKVNFGINYVVNSQTINNLDEASKQVEGLGSTELLLLPEVGFGRGVSVDKDVIEKLKVWVNNYKGRMKLSISASHLDVVNTSTPLIKESSVDSFNHIDASGVLKETSFQIKGVKISNTGIMDAISKLNTIKSGVRV